MAKATEGLSYVDPMFATNYQAMKANGLYRSAYHFAHPSEDAASQAQHFVDTVNSAGGFQDSSTFQLVLDLEDDDGLSSSQVWSWVQTWVSKMKVLTGKPPVIYTGCYFWNDSVGGSSNLDCPLWVASYTSPDPSCIPSAWSSVGWAFWQYDDNGARYPGGPAESIPGIEGNVDVNYFRNCCAYPDISYLCYA
eukprot:CAMPEP_0119126364 /NCGR_PEP_ID=MMETSP1310-20130426/5321_1 /TAXON_ID=464262 /ORGANISM="Genus nov. species nov., Strain RCC2339" /LENGTH=192 /DNA_ID=CAMNT_0007116521 /DNA_START=163 /DNA_END=741 /DNA_ORIENTATION=-